MSPFRLRLVGLVLVGLAKGPVVPAAISSSPGSPPANATTPLADDSIRVVLSEVLYAPRPGDTAFVELLNVGTSPVDLLQLVLMVGDSALPLPPLDAPLAVGTRAIVKFDGSGGTAGGVVHASGDFTLDPDSGSLEIRRDDDVPLDRIAWGAAPGAAALGEGALLRAPLTAGSAIGRPPDANTPGGLGDWVVYPAPLVSPGRANPLPAVVQLLPLDGAVQDAPTVDLAWYAVPGAARYRVQVSADSTFARPVLDQLVSAPELPAARLSLGAYQWRVQALDARGAAAPWSTPVALGIVAPDESSDSPDAPGRPPRGPSAVDASSVAPRVVLPVAFLTQHKDSRMLLLELPRQKGAHAWDVDHVTPSATDLADTKNCAIANVAMVNHFFGGDLSQDRIGFEVLSRNVTKYLGAVNSAPCTNCTTAAGTLPLGSIPGEGARIRAEVREVEPGPERDLSYGVGLSIERVIAALTYALGAPPRFVAQYGTMDAFWADVTAELDAGRPLIGANTHHAFVIAGYQVRRGHRQIFVNDPARRMQWIDIDASRLPASQLSTFILRPPPRVARQEPEVTRDSDGDGVVDFDELERFKTSPMNPDTDGDGVRDKEDIVSGVFETEFQLGYAYSPGPNNVGRDFDGDGLPTEIDADSDWPATGNAQGKRDGCNDGEEDTSTNGFHDGNETSNFNPGDDHCARLRGNLSFALSAQNPTGLVRSIDERLVIHVQLKPDPSQGPGSYIDDGSTYTYKGVAHSAVDTGDPTCTIWVREHASVSGPFAQANHDIGGTRADDGTLVIGASGDVPAQAQANLCRTRFAPATQRSFALGDCTGHLRQSAGGQRTYTFACGTRPNMGPGWTVTRYSVQGFVRVR